MSTLYHKLRRLSRGKPDFLESFYWAFITSAPTRPTKQAPTSNRKNVISISFILLYIIGTVKPITLIKSGKYRSFFSENNCRKSFDSNDLRRWRRASLSFYRLSISQMSQPDKPAQPKMNSVQAAYMNKSNLLKIILQTPNLPNQLQPAYHHARQNP